MVSRNSQLCNVETFTIVCDGDGNRVAEMVGGTTTKYLVDTVNPTGYAQVIDELVSGAVTRTYAFGLQRISENQKIGTAQTVSFYGYDGHGNVRYLTGTSGTATDTYVYDAFGLPLTTTGTTPNNFLYSGEQFDSTLGMYYLRARYYTPATDRFLTADPYQGRMLQPSTLHKYVYTGDDPVNAVDPTGRVVIVEVAFMYTRPGFGILAQGRVQFDPEKLLEKGWDLADAAQEVSDVGEHAAFAAHVALCDSRALINVAGVLGGVSNGGAGLSNLALNCFYNAARDPLDVLWGLNPTPELP